MELTLQPVTRRTVADEVFDRLLDEILAGTLAPGAVLPSERTMSEQLGVNRQAVREALQRLAQAGLVEIRHGGGTRVRDFRRHGGLGLFGHLLARPDGTLDTDAVRSLMELRATLGPDIAARCAERASALQKKRLQEALEALEASAGDEVARARHDLSFWECLVEGSDNLAYRLAFNTLRQVYEPVLPAVALVLAAEFGDLADHQGIVAAVSSGDSPGAQDAAWSLLARGTRAMESFLAAVDQQQAGIDPVHGKRPAPEQGK